MNINIEKESNLQQSNGMDAIPYVSSFSVKFRQSTPYGCGLYAIANALCFNSIIKKYRLNQCKKGCDEYKQNRWLIRTDYKIEVFWRNLFTGSKHLPPMDINLLVPDEKYFTPYLVSVKKNISDKLLHEVAILYKSDDFIIILDSLHEKSILTNKQDLFSGNVYQHIQQISGFLLKKDLKQVLIKESCFQ